MASRVTSNYSSPLHKWWSLTALASRRTKSSKLGLFSLFLSTGRNVSLDSVGAVDELVKFHKLIFYIISRVA